MSLPLFDVTPSASWATFGPEVNAEGDPIYRYTLGRSWAAGPRILWVMLNPSTATAETDDPTIRRCVGFAKAWGFGSLVVCNVFAYRATDPDDLVGVRDPQGPDNYHAIMLAACDADEIVVAWGAHHDVPRRAAGILDLMLPKTPKCLGITKAGAPRHPLYVRGDQPLVPWRAT